MKIKAKQFYMLLAFGIVLSFAGIIGAFYWGKGQLEQNQSEISQLIGERDAQRDNIIILQQADQQYDEIESVNNLLDTLVPKEKNQETLILDIIYTATSEAGIPFDNITAFSFSGSGDPDELSGTEKLTDIQNVYAYPFNLQITEITYNTLIKLLQEIENNGRIVQVSSIQIAPDKDSPGVLSSISLSMEAYVKP